MAGGQASAAERIRAVKSFHASNAAFGRAVIEARPFPELPTLRGRCRQLAEDRRTAADGRAVGRTGPGAVGAFGTALAGRGLKLAGRLAAAGDQAIVRRRCSI